MVSISLGEKIVMIPWKLERWNKISRQITNKEPIPFPSLSKLFYLIFLGFAFIFRIFMSSHSPSVLFQSNIYISHYWYFRWPSIIAVSFFQFSIMGLSILNIMQILKFKNILKHKYNKSSMISPFFRGLKQHFNTKFNK